VLKLSLHGISLQSVVDSISVARLVCPLLLQFKRDAVPSSHGRILMAGLLSINQIKMILEYLQGLD